MNFPPLSFRLQVVFNTIHSFIQHFIFRCFVLEILPDLRFVENTKTVCSKGWEGERCGCRGQEAEKGAQMRRRVSRISGDFGGENWVFQMRKQPEHRQGERKVWGSAIPETGIEHRA